MSRKDNGKNSSTDDLKNMLMSFRIAELQTLLATCGRSRSGRKHELLGRAVSLLKTSEGSAMRERVKSRILELYHQRYAGGSSVPTPNGTVQQSNPSTIPSTTYSHNQPYLPYNNDKDMEPTYLNRPNYNKQYTSQAAQRTSTTIPTIASSNNHDSRIFESRTMHPASIKPTNPDVKFIPLPFYDTIDILYKPTSLQQKTMSGFQDQSIVYHLTPSQTQLITNSRSYHIRSMTEYAVQVHLRFCLNETSCVQEDLYPTRCKIVVNGKGIPLPGQPPPNAQNQEPRKPHRPVNITSFCRLSPMQSNHIQVQWLPSDLGQQYAATVHLVKCVQAETLIQQLTNKPIRSKAHSIAFIKEKLSPDPDSEISMTSLKVSLCCPIGRTRMTMPCRSNNCKHLQCFDGATYIQMNERKPSWMCPVCDQKAYYPDLFKDGLFMSIISEASNCEDIVFYEDGSWRPLEDIAQGQDSIAEAHSTPRKTNTVPSPALTEATPTLVTINTPDTPAVGNPNPVSQPSVPPMPSLEPADATSNGGEQSQSPEEDVEVIMIDDSDSDSDDAPLQSLVNARESHAADAQQNSGETSVSTSSSSVHPISDNLQGLELYRRLPHEDRIAAAMYLDQNGILGQLNGSRPQPQSQPPSNIIDISDE